MLYAAAWITGEYAESVENPESVVESLLQPNSISLPPRVQGVYMQALLKVIASAGVAREKKEVE